MSCFLLVNLPELWLNVNSLPNIAVTSILCALQCKQQVHKYAQIFITTIQLRYTEYLLSSSEQKRTKYERHLIDTEMELVLNLYTELLVEERGRTKLSGVTGNL
jgi:hypothetical protein